MTVETAADDLVTLEIPSLTLTSPVAGRIVVTWTPPTDVGAGVRDYYLLWRKSGFAWNDSIEYNWVANSDDRRFVISGLSAGVSHDVSIRARATNFERGPFKVATITVSDTVVPDDTTITTDVSVFKITHSDLLIGRRTHAHLPSLTLTSDKTGKIDVSWGTPNRIYPFPASGFNINWAKADEDYPVSGETDGWATAAADVRSLTLSGLEAGVAYKVRVRTVNPSCCANANNWPGPWKEATITVASTTTVNIPGVEPAVTSVSLVHPDFAARRGRVAQCSF